MREISGTRRFDFDDTPSGLTGAVPRRPSGVAASRRNRAIAFFVSYAIRFAPAFEFRFFVWFDNRENRR